MTNPNPTRFVAFDVEADGPCPGLYSMVSLGLVDILDPARHFYAEIRPVADLWVPDALKVCGFSREQTLAFEEAGSAMKRLEKWNGTGRTVLVSDNPAFDWQWISYYTHRYLGANPFGHSARRIGDLYAGFAGDMRDTNGWKKWRQTRHTHNALDDARGVAEAWLELSGQLRAKAQMGLPGPAIRTKGP